MELTDISHNMNCAKFTESSEVNPLVVNSVKSATVCELENYNINSKEWEDLGKNREFLEIVDQIKEIAGVFEKWINLRLDTICSLRNVANYIDLIRVKSSYVKATGYGVGIVGSGVTAVGGILTVVTGSIAAPLLALGMGMNLTSGIGGAITRSREQKLTTKHITDAQQVIDSDQQTMKKLEEEIIKLTTHQKFGHKVQNFDSLRYLLAGYDSSIILNLIASNMTGSILSEEETELKTDNMEEIKLQKKELRQNMTRMPLKVLSRNLPFMLGTASMAYDFSLLSRELDKIKNINSSQASESVRAVANNMETSIEQILSPTNHKLPYEEFLYT